MSGSIKDTFTLTNGIKLPILGLGTYKTPDGSEVENAIVAALKLGYRHIDTASFYKNETGVGAGVRKSGIARSDVFVTTKCWNADIRAGYDAVLRAYDESLKLLKFDYLDLYLLHWPISSAIDREAWRALEKIYTDGRVKAIGVSNFTTRQLDDLHSVAKVKPMVNQVEFHPRLVQKDLLAYSKKHHIAHEAWSPLMQGSGLAIKELEEIARARKKSPAQVVLRWDLQHGTVTIPKSVNPKRLAENIDIYDFELSPEEMSRINALDQNKRIGPDPDHVTF
jgi:diketogulonate reductase-like aldo/keto reductase